MGEYYKEFLVKIKKIIKENPLLALSKIEVELNLPYIPRDFEQILRPIHGELKAKLLNQDINSQLSKDDVLDILQKPGHSLAGLALRQLANIHLESCIEPLRKIFKNKKISRVTKSIIYEFLVEQKVNKTFNINGHPVNPSLEGSIATQEGFVKTLNEISKLTFKNPSLQKISTQNFENFVLKTFPPHYGYDPIFAKIAVFIAREMLSLPPNTSLNETEIKARRLMIDVIKKIK